MKKTNNNELFVPEAYVAPTAKVFNVTLHRVLCDSDGYYSDGDVPGGDGTPVSNGGDY